MTMNRTTKRIIGSLAAVAVGATLLAGCGYSEEYQSRKDSQKSALKDSISRNNQEERLKREENQEQIRYVYILAPMTGAVLGYYTVNGKVSSSGVQNAPEQDVIQPFSGGDRYVVDSAKDDGTYGPSETGSFFFTTENVLIEIDGLAYIQSDSPIRLYVDAPLLNEK